MIVVDSFIVLNLTNCYKQSTRCIIISNNKPVLYIIANGKNAAKIDQLISRNGQSGRR